MREKKLKMELPPVIGYLHHSYHLSIAQEHPFFNEWFFCNYIQLKYYPKKDWLNFFSMDIHYNHFPLLDVQILRSEIIKNNKIDVVEFVINCIESDYYVWLYIDEFYDPDKEAYNTWHHTHEYLLYGYSCDKCCLHSVGFNNQFTQSAYTFSEISFDDFLKAFNNAEGNFQIKILKCNQNASYEFDIVNVKNILEDYVKSENTSKRNRMLCNPTSDAIYGMEIYKYLKMRFENPINSTTLLDIRPLHIMWEHKKCMVLRIKFLCDHQYSDNLDPIYNAYRDFEKKILILRNLQLRYIDTKKDHFINKIISYLDEISYEETQILTELLKCI